MNGCRRLVGAIGIASAICFAIAFVPGWYLMSDLESESIGALITLALVAILGVVVVASWSGFMVTSARVDLLVRVPGLVVLVAALTLSVFVGVGSSIGAQMTDTDQWGWAIPYLGAPILVGALFGGLLGAVDNELHLNRHAGV